MEGRIKIHRKLLDWGRYNDTPTRSVFLHLLLISNHKTTNWKGQEIMPGQCIVGRKELAKTLGLTEMQVRRAIYNQQSTGEITIKTTNRYSIITVCRWADYQYEEQKTTNKITNKQPATYPTNNQQTTTPKEYKNINKKEEENIADQKMSTFDRFLEMRKTIKKPATGFAIELLKKKLEKLGKTEIERERILENSIMNNRQDLYPLKEEQNLEDPAIFKKRYNDNRDEDLKRLLGKEKFFEMKKLLLASGQ